MVAKAAAATQTVQPPTITYTATVTQTATGTGTVTGVGSIVTQTTTGTATRTDTQTATATKTYTATGVVTATYTGRAGVAAAVQAAILGGDLTVDQLRQKRIGCEKKQFPEDNSHF